jgi:hypothetical protein
VKQSILNITVSGFENCKSISPKEVNLLSWLTSDKYRDKVEQVRKIQDENIQKVIKASLPAITPSGTFSTRSEKGLIEHSGFMAFDIDFKDNSDITNFDELKKQLSKLSNVAYCGLSVRGRGFWGCVPIPGSTPELHKQRFNALAKDFKDMGIVLDPSGSDVCRLRIYSFDPEGYFNHNAKPYTKILKPQPKRTTRPALTDSRERVEAVISQIKENRIDITQSYKGEWFLIASGMANEFGESGRGYFHAVSRYHLKYNESETDRMFDDVLKKTYSKISIGSFFKIASDYGIKQNIAKESIDEIGEFDIEVKEKEAEWLNEFYPHGVRSDNRVAKMETVKMPATKKESAPGPWDQDITELEQFFNAVGLPEAHIQLSAVERITDPSLFIKTHLDIVKGQNGNMRYAPYLERLKELRTILSN